MRDLHVVLKSSAAQLRSYASILERLLQTRGDEQNAIGKEIRDARATATEAEELARLHKPDPRVLRWSRGTATAARSYRPGAPGRPS